jgi:hypothetical protein
MMDALRRAPVYCIIPPNLYPGWKNIGSSEAISINMPTEMYDYEAPDELDALGLRTRGAHRSLSSLV